MFLFGTLDGKTVSIPYKEVNQFFINNPEVTLHGKPLANNPYGEDNHPLHNVMTD